MKIIKLKRLREIKSSLSLKKKLIDLNVQLDSLNSWIQENGEYDYCSTLFFYDGEILPDPIINIILLEDKGFFRHKGFELMSIPRSIKRFWKVGKIGGVSTIDQQLVRTYLKRRERTLERKLREIVLAVLINFHHSKYEILLSYSNSAYFGPHMNGIDTAAIRVFGITARDLSSDQSAFLACLLPYPIPPNVARWLTQPIRDPQILIDRFGASNPWWASKVSHRMKHLQKLRSKYLVVA